MKIDLHTHSDFSDGLLSPKDLIDWFVTKNITLFALTDHDSVMGLDQAQKRAKEVKHGRFIMGTEISCMFCNRMVHLVGLFPQGYDPGVEQMLQNISVARMNRAQEIIAKLNKHGFDIKLEDIEISKSNTTGRAHIARALYELGYFDDPARAFDEYLNDFGKAFVPINEVTLEHAVSVINSGNGLSFLAHPDMKINHAEIKLLADYGTTGLEILHPSITKSRRQQLFFNAKKFNLSISGGSDYHGNEYRGPYQAVDINPGDYGTDWIFELASNLPNDS